MGQYSTQREIHDIRIMNYGRRQTPAVVLAVTIGVFTIGFVGAVGANAGWTDSGSTDAHLEDEFAASAGESVLQNDQRAPVAALLGIVALTLMGGTLAVRNRLAGRRVEAETGSDARGEELVTDRDRIRRLVSQNGGRM